MAIAAFVDAPLSKQDMAVELATAVAEFCISRHETLFLLADAITALEVGMSLIGSRESRTVEGGDYRASPLVLLPFIPRPETPEDRALRTEAESDIGGDIAELYELGLFARRGEGATDFEFGSEPSFALEQVIARQNPRKILGLSGTPSYWQAVGRGMEQMTTAYHPQILTVEGFGSSPFVHPEESVVIRPPELVPIHRPASESRFEVDDLEAARREAERDGSLVAALFSHLIG